MEELEPILPPPDHEPAPPAERHDASAKASSLTVSVLIHAAILVILAFITVGGMKEPPPELTVMSSEMTSTEPKLDKRIFDKVQKTQPSSSSKAAQLLATNSVAPLSIPTIETDNISPTIGTGMAFGTGMGFGGTGSGAGAKFFGSTSTGKRFAFIIDVSLSLSDLQFQMIKDELAKSLKQLPSSVQYQVIFFSGPAWFAESEYDSGRKQVTHGGKRYQWNKGNDNYNFVPEDQNRLYTAKWLPATKSNLARTKSRIDKVHRSVGTDWKWPVYIALEMSPKPDVIYFLTDGSMEGGDVKVAEAIRYNDRKAGPRTKINTISMMEPRAIDDLSMLAEKTGGVFTIVERNGKTRQPNKKK